MYVCDFRWSTSAADEQCWLYHCVLNTCNWNVFESIFIICQQYDQYMNVEMVFKHFFEHRQLLTIIVIPLTTKWATSRSLDWRGNSGSKITICLCVCVHLWDTLDDTFEAANLNSYQPVHACPNVSMISWPNRNAPIHTCSERVF